MVKGLDGTGYANLSCFLHTLQLVVKDGIFEQWAINDIISCCRTIVEHFKHSTKETTELKKIQEDNEVPEHQLIGCNKMEQHLPSA